MIIQCMYMKALYRLDKYIGPLAACVWPGTDYPLSKEVQVCGIQFLSCI